VIPPVLGARLLAEPMGPGKSTFVWELVPTRFVRHPHVQKVLRFCCGGCAITGPAQRSFLAQISVAKCAGHMPLYRLEKELARNGVPVSVGGADPRFTTWGSSPGSPRTAVPPRRGY
jgi:hypothetical protein